MSVYEALQGIRCVPRSVPIVSVVTPWQVLSAIADSEPDLVFLSGEWADGSVLLATQPLCRADPLDDPAKVLAVQPELANPEPAIVGGGWFGVLGYETTANYLAFYDHLLRWDPRNGWRFEMLQSDQRAVGLNEALERWANLLRSLENNNAGSASHEPRHVWKLGTFLPAGSPDLRSAQSGHLAAVEHAVGRIRRGDIYQVNVCTRFGAMFEGNAAQMFAVAAQKLGPARGAYVRNVNGDGDIQQLASFSPELFLQRRGAEIWTRPIKGTRPMRGSSGSSAYDLAHSAKDVAENVMIVDLMRNDLARVCEPGSVRTPDLLRVEPHAGVWHLLSTVVGQLRPGCTDGDLIASCFPPGSVTGAPKIKATQVIAEIEPLKRGAYTGAIGFASPSWGLELNVVIRTLEIANGVAEIGVGGGVTTDSVPQLEWQECLDKLAPVAEACEATIAQESRGWVSPNRRRSPVRGHPSQDDVALLETMLAVNGRVLRLADHLGRLARSAAELWGALLPSDIADRVAQAVSEPGRQVVRLVATRSTLAGEEPVTVQLTSTAAPLTLPARGLRLMRRTERSWRHKWADREELAVLETAASSENEGDLPLFIGENGEVAELSRGNLFLLSGITLRTPPLDEQVLAGVTRRAVLDVASELGLRAEIAPITTADLYGPGVTLFWTSSVSGVVPIERLDGQSLVVDAEGAAVITRLRARLGFAEL